MADQITKAEVELVQECWQKLKPSWKTIGADFLLRLFVKYPKVKSFFHMFDGIDDLEEIRASKKMKAHVINLGNGLATMFDHLTDHEMLEIFIKKLAANHARRKITANEFDVLFKEFAIYLSEDPSVTKEVLSAWEKAFAVIFQIFKEALDSASNEKEQEFI